MSKVAMIAAMEREVAPLVRSWRRTTVTDSSRNFVAFESEAQVVVICGVGRKNAELAARAAVAQYEPGTLISIGLAGALIRSLKVGSVVTPNVVVDAADGNEYRCAAVGDTIGGGILVTADAIASPDAKQQLVERFHALVVDMEAAGVAKVAQEVQTGFCCVKAISDEADFVMPPLAQFVDPDGNFHSGKFAAWTVLRPWHWARVAALGRNSSRATRALCAWLEKSLAASVTPPEVVTLTRAEFPEIRTKQAH
jgi:adenosylhomocysteine nucleosidase